MKKRGIFKCVLAIILSFITLFTCFACTEKVANGDYFYGFSQEEVNDLKSLLNGKKISILGDSISTFLGVSNSVTTNNTLALNESWYTKNNFNRSDTWWQQTVNSLNLQLLVNNSWSASSVTTCRQESTMVDKGGVYNQRCLNLHDNTLKNNDNQIEIYPDIIVFYMGTNDLWDNVYCGESFDKSFFEMVENVDFVPSVKFDEAYALTLYKIKQKYPNASVFCFNLPIMGISDSSSRMLYNNAIEAISNYYGCNLVDLFNTELSQNFAENTIDTVHPNKSGMDIMTVSLIKEFKNYYLCT